MGLIYHSPIFWKPTNALGIAATVKGEHNKQGILINFYWSAIDLTFRRNYDLRDEINNFLVNHPLLEPLKKNRFHVESNEYGFRERIDDPGWVPPDPENTK